MGSILAKAISLILVIIIGFAIKKAGWVSLSDFPKFSKIVLRITFPCALIISFNEFAIHVDLLFLVVLGIVANVLQQTAGFLMGRGKDKKEQAFSILNIGGYNIGLFALPYISSFIGAQSVIYCSLFDTGNSLATSGTAYGWSMSVAKSDRRITPWSFIRLMFSSPVFVTYFVLLIMGLLDWHFPQPFLTFASVVGGANTFLAMLMIGIGLELRLNPSKLKLAITHLGVRYGFSILFTIITLLILPFSHEIKTVLCMLFFSPMAAMISGFTSEVGGDVETASFITSVSIIISIFAMPLMLAVLA